VHVRYGYIALFIMTYLMLCTLFEEPHIFYPHIFSCCLEKIYAGTLWE